MILTYSCMLFNLVPAEFEKKCFIDLLMFACYYLVVDKYKTVWENIEIFPASWVSFSSRGIYYINTFIYKDNSVKVVC